MSIIYLLNNLVNSTPNILCQIKYKFYLYQNSNFIFIKKKIIFIRNQNLSLSKIKFYLYQNFISFLPLII